MKDRAAKHAARMRCKNTEYQRRRLWKAIERGLAAGRITAAEAKQMKIEFWRDRLEDKLIAKGRSDGNSAG